MELHNGECLYRSNGTPWKRHFLFFPLVRFVRNLLPAVRTAIAFWAQAVCTTTQGQGRPPERHPMPRTNGRAAHLPPTAWGPAAVAHCAKSASCKCGAFTNAHEQHRPCGAKQTLQARRAKARNGSQVEKSQEEGGGQKRPNPTAVEWRGRVGEFEIELAHTWL